MRTYLRLLEYVLPYWRKVVLLFVAITMFASLSGMSLTLIPPFLRIVLYGKDVTADVGAAGDDIRISKDHGIPLPAALQSLKSRATSWFDGRIYAGDQKARLLRFCKILLLLFVLKNLFAYLQTYLTVYLEQKVLYRIRNDVYAYLHKVPLTYFEREKTGHLVSRITNDVSSLRGAVIGAAASLIRNSLMTIIALIIILLVSWKLSLLTLVVLPLNAFFVSIVGRKLKKRSFRAQEGMADMTTVIQESVSGMRVVKAFNMGDFESRRFDRFNNRYMRQFLRMKLWGALSSPISELLGAASVIGILWYGGNLVVNGVIRPESLFLFVGAMLWVVTPVKELSKLNNVIQESLASAHRVFSLLDVPREPLHERSGAPKAVFRRSIRFESVGFEYVSGRKVLRDLSFTVQPGEVIALVGPSGSGKSTLVDLIPRFYDPTEGRILLDEVDLRDLDLRSLRDMMGIVTQETILFNDTVRNNIAYGIEDCPSPRLIESAKTANAHEFISLLPAGYETIIGERGTQLSGGERQRLAIARAILKDPQVLILDEATSALDTESEYLVQEAIDRLLQGRTTFIIAHRLSTIQNADRILVLKDGALREFGTHEELIHSNGVYKKLYELQFGLVS